MDRQVRDFNVRLRTIRIRELIVGIIISIILSGVVVAIFPGFYDNDDLLFILLLSFMLFFFAWCLRDTVGLSEDFEKLFLKENMDEILYVFAINIIFAFIFLFVIVIMDFAMGIVDPTWITGFDIDHVDLTPGAFLFSAIATILYAPVMEELIFRGVIFNRLKIRTGIVPAMVISSFIFAIGHDFGGIISAFLFGICMCILYLKTDNILIPMSVHFINNLVATLLDVINIDSIVSQFPWIILLGGLVGVSTILLIKYILDEIGALKIKYN